MKNAIIAVLTVTTLVVGYIAATSTLRLSLESLEGKTEPIVRGDLVVPINATGTIRPRRRVQIKPEASGEVVEIARRAGERVRAGERLIRLEPDEEQRAVERATRELERAKARLEEARLALKQAKTADLQAAEARVKQIEASLRLAKYRADRAREHPDLYHEEERLQRESQYEDLLAQLASAKANLEKARLAIPRAEQAVKQMEAAYESAKQTLGDAKQRLEKTDLVSPIDGIVADIRTDIGEVIQGGKTTITGGTVVAVVLDMKRLVVQAEVDEADIGRVLAIAPPWSRPGHSAGETMPEDLQEAAAAVEHLPEITVESFPNETFHGVIERIYPEPKLERGVVTYLVDVVILGDEAGKLLPGMRADVRFTSEHAENVLLCPNEAIREGPGGALGVFVPDPDAPPNERATRFVPCEFGLDNGNYSEVRSGLKEGDVVYTKLPAPRRGKEG
ncbi:MAG: HlyD family efflux transporter periplasmic adaptor subunit [Planctomycetota bacterium]|nr:MAG: HlyD family efflux transporter periplasmic adaptor subunit [Planctomycetota bacterium]